MCDSENATTLPKVNGKPSRRTILKAGAALVTAGTAAVPAMAAPHPDAALIQALQDWLQAVRDFDALPYESLKNDEVVGPIESRMESAEDCIANTPALTPRGAACKVRWAWAKLNESASAEHTLTYGGPADPKDVIDWRFRTLWELAGDLDLMGGAA